jgi:hypothetical protein
MITLTQPSLVLNSYGVRTHHQYSFWRTWSMPQGATVGARLRSASGPHCTEPGTLAGPYATPILKAILRSGEGSSRGRVAAAG